MHPVLSFWVGLVLQLLRSALLLLADALVWCWHRAGDMVATLRYYHETRTRVMREHRVHDDRRSAEYAELLEAHNPWRNDTTARDTSGSRPLPRQITPGSRSATLRSRLSGIAAAVARVRQYLPRRRG